MPPVTCPFPPPAIVTLNELDGGGLETKFALTEAEDVERATTHEPVPVHAPLQLENVLSLLAAAVRVTLVPCENVPEHVPLEQEIPAGLLVTAPPPLISMVNKLIGSEKVVNLSTLGGLSFPDVSYAVTAK